MGFKQEHCWWHWKSDGPSSSGLLSTLRLKSHLTPQWGTQGIWHHTWGLERYHTAVKHRCTGKVSYISVFYFFWHPIRAKHRQGINLQADIDSWVGGVQRWLGAEETGSKLVCLRFINMKGLPEAQKWSNICLGSPLSVRSERKTTKVIFGPWQGSCPEKKTGALTHCAASQNCGFLGYCTYWDLQEG